MHRSCQAQTQSLEGVVGNCLTEHIVLSLASGCTGYVTLFCSTELPGRGARTDYWQVAHLCQADDRSLLPGTKRLPLRKCFASRI